MSGVIHSDNNNGGNAPLQFRVLCFCRENNLHMHKFAFRILIYMESPKSPSTSAATSAQNRVDKTSSWAKHDNDDEEEANRKKGRRRNKWPSDIKTFTRDCSFCADSGWFLFFFLSERISRKKIIKN